MKYKKFGRDAELFVLIFYLNNVSLIKSTGIS